jgi:hypothetical protein
MYPRLIIVLRAKDAQQESQKKLICPIIYATVVSQIVS